MSALPLRCPGRRSGRRSEVEPPEHPSRNGAGQAGEDGGVIRGDHEAHDSDAIIVKALMSSNLLCLLSGSNSYLQQLKRTMNLQVSRRNRDAFDMAGKLPLALKALSIGIPMTELLIDTAQAGGLHGKSDGCIVMRRTQRQPDGSSQTVTEPEALEVGCT